MGTYTSNYNLFMPSIGEQGWGDLVNGNFTTIDTTMSGLNTRVETLETEGDAIAQRVGTLEGKVSVLDTGNFGNINGGNITMNTATADTVITKPVHIQNSVVKWLEDASNYIYTDFVVLTMPTGGVGEGTHNWTIPAPKLTGFKTPWSIHSIDINSLPSSVTVTYTISLSSNNSIPTVTVYLDGTQVGSGRPSNGNKITFNITFNPRVSHTLKITVTDTMYTPSLSCNKSKLIICE